MASEREAAGLSRSLAYMAALKAARFGTANEHPDWEIGPSRLHLRHRRPPGCSSGSRGPTGTVASRPCPASCTPRWRFTALSRRAACRIPGDADTTQGRMNDLFSRPIWERMKLSGSAPSNLPSTTTVLFE